jgi:hypothetical protein
MSDLTVKRIPVNLIDADGRHRKEMGDLDKLAESIRTVGLLQPIVVCKIPPRLRRRTGEGHEVGCEYRLIAGARRLAAVGGILERRTIPAYVVEDLDGWNGIYGRPSADDNARLALTAERDENTCRKDFTPSEAVRIGKALEELEGGKAQERKQATQARKGEGKVGTAGGGNFPPPGKGKTADKVGEAVGMSGKTYTKAKAVVEAAEEEPEKFGDLPGQMDAAGKVDGAYQEMKKRAGQEGGREKAQEAGGTKLLGVGVFRANEAIDCLSRIPKNDRLRERGFQIVTDWIKRNR